MFVVRWRFAGVVVAAWLVLVCSASAEEGKASGGKEKSPSNAAPSAGKAESAAKADPFKVPDGTPEELLKYIAGLKKLHSETTDKESPRDFAEKVYVAAAEAAMKVLADHPTDAQADEAAQYAGFLLMALARLGGDDGGKRLAELIDKLEKGGQPQLARQLRGARLVVRLQKSIRGKPKELANAVADIKTHLSEAPLGRLDISLAIAAVQAAEISGDRQLTIDTCTSMAKLLSKNKEKTALQAIPRMEGVVRRLELVGKSIKIEGVYLDGAPFDAAKYAGKVVLVDFWASWCGPCRAELPHMKDVYEKYHGKGFEIIGISLDRGRKPLEEFLAKEKLPWPILYNEKELNPTIGYYGVSMIPTMILADQHGKVVSITARGPQLDTELKSLLGPAESTAAEKKPAEAKQP